MYKIDINTFRSALNKIDDGFVFENFGLSFLTAIFGYSFNPVGGVKDKGIDGLQHTFHRDGFEKNIYQLSTELNSESKIIDSIDKLNRNKIKYDSLKYITNRKVANKDVLTDKLFDWMTLLQKG